MNKKLIKTIASITCGLGVVATIPTISTSCNSSWPTNAIPREYLDISDGVLYGFKNIFNPDEHISDGYDTLLIPKDVVIIAKSAFDKDEVTKIGVPKYIRNIEFEDNSKINSIQTWAFDFGDWTPDKITFPEGLTHIGELYSYSTGASTITLPSTLDEILQNELFNGEIYWISNIVFNNIDLNNNHSWLQKINSDTFGDALPEFGTIRVSGNSVSTSEEVLNYLINHTTPQSGNSPFRTWIAL